MMVVSGAIILAAAFLTPGDQPGVALIGGVLFGMGLGEWWSSD